MSKIDEVCKAYNTLKHSSSPQAKLERAALAAGTALARAHFGYSGNGGH